MHRFGGTKFADIGAAGERFSGTGNHNGFHRSIGLGLLHTVGNTLARSQAQTIDGGVIQRNDGNVAVDFVMGSHAFNP